VIGVIGPVGDEAAQLANPSQQGTGDADVVDVASCQEQGMRPTLAITQGVELARFAPARLAERLEVGPPFAPPAERCALM
jgi:hypothetical protein